MKQEGERNHWSQLSMLDVLRPPPGSHVSDVVLSTYSLDLVVLASVLLALTGRDKLDGGGSKVGLASAIDHFRPDSENRLTVLVQSGQIAIPRVSATILALLDRFVTEVRRDQSENSWHAKAALVRFATDGTEPGEQEMEWRLWIGSRNLSRDVSWDSGLVLTSRLGEGGSNVDGLPKMAGALLEQTGWEPEHQNRLLRELRRVSWKMPSAVRVEQVALLDGKELWRPALLEAPDETLVITPFFDLKALSLIQKAAGDSVPPRLLTTQLEMDRRLSANPSNLSGWEVSCLDSSEQAEVALSAPEVAEEADGTSHTDEWRSDDEEVMMGLHAKIIAQRKGDRVRLWMGSANVTMRAWERNAELVAMLEGGTTLWEGLEALMGMANHADLASATEDAVEATRERLDRFRHKLSLLDMRQIVEGERVVLQADRPLFCLCNTQEQAEWEQLQMRLEVAPLTRMATDYVPWPWTQQAVSLPLLAHSLAGDSAFLQFRLQCHPEGQQVEEGPTTLAWVQRVELAPTPGVERDRRILAGYLNPHQFLAWIRGMLEGYETDGEPWEGTPRGWNSHAGSQGSWKGVDTPTLESLLKAWQRDRKSIEHLAETLDRYLDEKVMRQYSQDETSRQWIAMLEAFRCQLEQLRGVLGDKAT